MPRTRTPGACGKRSSATPYSGGRGSLPAPLPCRPRRLLEQQSEERARGQTQQERHRKPEQQCRLPCGQHAPTPEPLGSRTQRASSGASRGRHDEWGRRARPGPAPVLAFGRRAPVLFPAAGIRRAVETAGRQRTMVCYRTGNAIVDAEVNATNRKGTRRGSMEHVCAISPPAANSVPKTETRQ